MTLAELVTKYQELKAQRTALTAQADELKAQMDELELQMLVELDKTGMDNATVRGVGTVIKKTEIVPTITDWDEMAKAIREQDLLFLFQRRLNASAYRDLLQQGITVSGLVPTEITKISVRKN